MENEKIKILKMLEERKITAEEAGKMLEAIGKPARESTRSDSSNAYNGQRPTGGYYRDDREDFLGDMVKKFENFARDVEPKLRKFTGTVADKTSDIADKISKSMEKPPEYRSPEPLKREEYNPARYGSGSIYNERNFEIIVSAGENELNLAGFNGDVKIKGYNGDKITAKINCKPKSSNAEINLLKFGNKYTLNYEENDFDTISIDAFVPENLFSVVNIKTVNGKVDIATISTTFFSVNALHRDILLNDITTKYAKIDCSSGKTTISNFTSEQLQLDNFGGEIIINDIDIENMKINGSNNRILMNIHSFSKFKDYTWIIETNNDKITMNLPSSTEIAYHLKSKTILDTVRIGLVGLEYIVNCSNNVEAKSYNYNDASKHIKIVTETSNAPININ